MEEKNREEKSVFVALVGRPNVGKSSLLNVLVGEKVAIVTSKPQTTRTRITGILTKEDLQYVFLDTPGIHKARTKLGERMGRAASSSVSDGDVTAMLFEPYGQLNDSEKELAAELGRLKVSAVAVVNKSDLLKTPDDATARAQEIMALGVFKKVLFTSTVEETGTEELLAELLQLPPAYRVLLIEDLARLT